MKDKKSLYILLPAAAALWGYIIYLVVSGMGGGNDTIIQAAPPIVTTDTLTFGQDSFALSLSYSDPFLKKQKPIKTAAPTTSPANSAPKKPKPPKKPVEDNTINWPPLTYGGSISGMGSKKEVIILIVGSDEFLVKEGDEVKGVKVNHIAPNAIGLEYKGATKTISR